MGKKIVIGKDIVKIYGEGENKVEAISEVSIDIEEGDFICIMGPSGSGKSTLLNLLSTVDMPSGGLIKIDNTNVYMLSDKQLSDFRYGNIGFIFQNCNLLSNLTIEENIGFPLVGANVKNDEIAERVLRVAKDLKIDNLLKKIPGKCSGGERQRVAAARALVTNPKVIIGDEITGNLDSYNTELLMDLISNLNKDKNNTVVLVTHDSMVASYSKKVVYLKDGKIHKILEKEDFSDEMYLEKIIAMAEEGDDL